MKERVKRQGVVVEGRLEEGGSVVVDVVGGEGSGCFPAPRRWVLE